MAEEKKETAAGQQKNRPGNDASVKWPKALLTPEKTVREEKQEKSASELFRTMSRETPRREIKSTKRKKTVVQSAVQFADDEEERSYMPVRFSRDGKIGCLGGIMFFLFIVCASIVLAAFAWMSASDVLALNKADREVEIVLPETAFTEHEVEVTDANGNVTGKKTVHIADIDAVSAILRDNGIINYRWLFRFYSSFSHAEEKLDPGTYTLNTNLDYRALVKKMQSGAVAQLQVLVTLPEGYNMDQIFAKLEENGVCSRAELYAAASTAEYSYVFLEGMERGEPSRMEGFLYPDTYYFYQNMQGSSALNKFLSNMYYKFTEEMQQRAAEMNMSVRQILTVASIIEKEAANDDERPLIASVIYNRINSGMPLQMDSTLFYALREQEDPVINTDVILSTDSPYNTYLYNGLPPTPICSPGMASIMAALYPENTNYLYFALDEETNTMRFFIYLSEHEAFVATQSYGQ